MTAKELEAFLDQYTLCVISTVGPEGAPQSAVVGFSVHEGCQLVMATSNETRKFQNIERDPRVSVVIGWDDLKTVQYEGRARTLTTEELKDWQEKHFSKQPHARKFKDDPHERYILVTPTWARYTDITQTPWAKQVISLDA